MANEDAIHEIIERIESARDRCQNASDAEGVKDAEQALADLRALGPGALPTARDIEEYFLERALGRTKGNQSARTSAPATDDDVSDDS